MNRERVASELVKLAKSLESAVWSKEALRSLYKLDGPLSDIEEGLFEAVDVAEANAALTPMVKEAHTDAMESLRKLSRNIGKFKSIIAGFGR